MKKLKYWSMMMLMVMALPLMMACGSDANGGDPAQTYADKLLGTWKFVEINAQYGSSIASGWTPIVGNMVLQIDKNETCSLSGSGSYEYQFGEDYMIDIKLGDYKIWKVGTINEEGFDCILWLYYKNNKGEEKFDAYYLKFNSNNEIILRSPIGLMSEYKLRR